MPIATRDLCDPATAARPRDLVNTPSAEFWAHFDSYLDMVANHAVRRIDVEPRWRWVGDEDHGYVENENEIPGPTIFARLVEIGVRHYADGVAFTKTQMLDMVRRSRDYVADPVCWACDHQMMDPSWRAPRFLLMVPVGPEPFDPVRAFERLDEAGTAKVLDSLADQFERRLRERIELAARDAYLAEAAKRPPAEKIIDMKVIQRRGTEAQEDQATPQEQKPTGVAAALAPKASDPAPEANEDTKTKRRRDCMKRLMEDPDLSSFTRDEAAIMLNLSVRTIDSRVDDGTLLLNRAGRITGKSILPYLKEQPKKRQNPAHKKV